MRRIFLLTLLLTFAASASLAPTARAQGTCASSQAANSLLSCEHCKAVKQLLTDASIGDVSFEVHEMSRGVLVEVEGTTPAGVELVHSLVDEMWSPASHCETKISDACRERYEHIGKAGVDRALTEKGVILVLSSEDTELVTWLREDAQMTRNFVLTAATAD